MAKRLGVIPHRYAQPVFYGLKERPATFEVVEDHAASLALKLREKELDGAFLSPIDYARGYAMYSVVPNVGVASEGESGSVLVLFKEHLHTIKTLAVDVHSSSEIVLSHLVFAEKYGTVPQIIPVIGSLEQIPDKADAALLIGDAALAATKKANKLDLVDEWKDITGMPFVHGVWAAREKSFSMKETKILIDSAQLGATMLDTFSQPIPAGYLERFQYDLNEDAVSSLSEFFRMAYYYGILKDIPDIRFHSLESEQLPPLSLN